jgi:uncharacterized coiled-coil protein SlyX
MTEGQRLAKLLTKAEMTRRIDNDAKRLAEQDKVIAGLRARLAECGESLAEVETWAQKAYKAFVRIRDDDHAIDIAPAIVVSLASDDPIITGANASGR